MTPCETSACRSEGNPATADAVGACACRRAVASLFARFAVTSCCMLLAACGTAHKNDSGGVERAPEPLTADPASIQSQVDAARPSLEHGQIGRALDALLNPLPKPLRILTITALPSMVVVQVQNTQNPNEVHQYQYTHKDGRVEGPLKVKLQGKGSLKDNLFRPPSAEPRMAEDALSNVTNQYKHPARKLVMIRNLPESMDIQFRVYLDTPGGELAVVTDKHGRVLGPLAAANPSSPQ
jgi:hypothetical protein